MHKTLVTGGCGFIGSHLVEALVERGYQVVVLDNLLRGNKLPPETRSRVDFIEADVRDFAAVKKAMAGCFSVFHLAAYLGVDVVAENPVEAMEIEAIGTHNIVRAALDHQVSKIVYSSTSGVYGRHAIDQSVDEDFEVSPTSSYAIAKRFNEIYLQSVYRITGLESVSLRYFNVYGPRQDTRMVIPRFVEQAFKSEPITVYGNGTQTRDFTFIDDTVNATIAALQSVSGCHLLNVANGNDQSIRNLAETVVSLMESRSEIKFIDPPEGRSEFEVMRRAGNSAKLERLTGLRPSIPLAEGLPGTIDAIVRAIEEGQFVSCA